MKWINSKKNTKTIKIR